MGNVKYRFYLYENDAVLYGDAFSATYHYLRELFPVNGQDLKYHSEYETNQVFKRTKLTTDLIFLDDPKNSISDFSFLLAKQRAGLLCYEYRIKVEQLCGLGYVPYWEGYFSLAWGRWDEDQCKLTLLPEVNDRYRCLLDAGQKKFNILELTNIRSLIVPNNIQLEYITCPQRTVFGITTDSSPCVHVHVTLGTGHGPPIITAFSCITPGQGWMVYYSKYTVDTAIIPNPIYIITTWVREVSTTLDVGGLPNSPAGAGWVQIGSTIIAGYAATKWARVPYNGAFQTYTTALVIPGGGAQCYVSFSWEAPDTETEHTRLRTFADVANLLFSQCGDSVRSDIFDMNSPEDNSISYVTGLTNKLRFILIEQKSDALKPTASQGATIGELNFTDFTTILRHMFNCFWDFIDGVIRIEHLSFFQRTNGLDLTAPQFANMIKASNKYDFSLKDLPKFERWILKDSGGMDFVGQDVSYNNICVNQDAETNTAQYDISLVSTDIDYLQRNPDDLSKDGFVFFCCSFTGGQYVLNQDIGILTGIVQLNGHFSLANLLPAYHLHGRILESGTMNGISQIFLSYKRYKRQNVFNIQLCCDTPYNNQEFMKTFLGWGEIFETEFSTKNNTLAVTLKHL